MRCNGSLPSSAWNHHFLSHVLWIFAAGDTYEPFGNMVVPPGHFVTFDILMMGLFYFIFFHEFLLCFSEGKILLLWFYFDSSDASLNLPFPWLEVLNQTDIKHDCG